MKERPILFSAPMVRTLLDGSKTQTRRIMKPQPQMVADKSCKLWEGDPLVLMKLMSDIGRICPYGQPGDRLWVRETFTIVPRTAYRCSEGVQQVLRPDDDHDAAIFREGWTRSRSGFRWRPSIHMPRWASRITLEVIGVRAERLQDISAVDAIAEGIEGCDVVINGISQGKTWRDYSLKCDDPCEWFTSPIGSYRSLWEQINGAGSWDANPWVWVIEFRRIEHAHQSQKSRPDQAAPQERAAPTNREFTDAVVRKLQALNDYEKAYSILATMGMGCIDHAEGESK